MKNKILAAGFLCMIACGGKSTPSEPISVAELRNLQVENINFDSSFFETGDAEIEVHVIDAKTRRSVLCAGVQHGMKAVQSYDTSYENLGVTFIPTHAFKETEITQFKIALVERDSRHCPDSLTESQGDSLGETRTLSRTDLPTGDASISFTFKKNGKGTIALTKPATPESTFAAKDLLNLKLKSIMINEIKTNEFSDPEMEVHLLDIDSNQVLACMGRDQGLSKVTQLGENYDYLFSSFTQVPSVDPETQVKRVRIVLVERDAGVCPQAFRVSNDNIIASSRPLTYEQLRSGVKTDLALEMASLEIGDLPSFQQSLSQSAVTGLESLKVQSLRFEGDPDEFSGAEIEVHLFDAVNGNFLACAGAAQGLGKVTDKSILYENLNTGFLNTGKAETFSGALRVAIVDRDDGKCPDPASLGTDDFLAEKSLSADDLTKGPVLFSDGSEIIFSK